MSGNEPRIGLVAAAMVAAGLLVSTSILYAAFNRGPVATTTVTQTAAAATLLHKVIFNETGIHCSWSGQPSFISRWYVTLGEVTIVQPSNATLPFPDPGVSTYGDYGMISKIVFTVPDGTYQYHGSLGLNGTAVVNGSDVVIQVYSYPTC